MDIDKMTTVTLSLNDLIRIVVSTTNHLESEEQDKIIQTFASKLYEWYDVPSVELSETLVNFGFYAHTTCCQCNEIIPNFTLRDTEPICSDCDTDADSVG